MTELISIVVVDDHPLFREGVVATLLESGLFEVVAQGGSKDDAVRLAEVSLRSSNLNTASSRPVIQLGMFKRASANP